MENHCGGYLGQFMGGALAAGDPSCGKPFIATDYEITLPADTPSPEAIQAAKEAIEKREAFVASGCIEKFLERGAKAHIAFSCANSDNKTDAVFRDAAVNTGGQLQTATISGSASTFLSTCKLKYCCTGFGYPVLCNILNQPCNGCK